MSLFSLRSAWLASSHSSCTEKEACEPGDAGRCCAVEGVPVVISSSSAMMWVKWWQLSMEDYYMRCSVHIKMVFLGGQKAERVSAQECKVYLLCSLRAFQFPLRSTSVWLDWNSDGTIWITAWSELLQARCTLNIAKHRQKKKSRLNILSSRVGKVTSSSTNQREWRLQSWYVWCPVLQCVPLISIPFHHFSPAGEM